MEALPYRPRMLRTSKRTIRVKVSSSEIRAMIHRVNVHGRKVLKRVWVRAARNLERSARGELPSLLLHCTNRINKCASTIRR
jgi:hypothetical protein